ncbi:MAG: M50 family metallopeptidase [Candidatus Omnitrophica bacterium]|nr:M50 family metallopeptidase [Candidatus Omnitrophota bacterium]
MIAKALRLAAGILLLPVDLAYGIAFYRQMAAIQRLQAPEVSLLLGVTGYLAFHVLVAAPTRAYVFGHELTHAAAAWLSGGQVKGFKVGAKKGSVTTNRVTAFIALAPYLIPVFSLIWALLWAAAGFFWNTGRVSSWFFVGLGATLAFHLVFTVNVLKEKQSDLEGVGPLLALGLILWANLTLVVGVIGLMVPEVHFVPYLTDGFHRAQGLYQAIFHQLFSL